MHNLVVAEYIVRSGFLSSGSPTCTFGFHDEMPKSTAFRRSGMYGNPCWSVRINNSQGIYNTTTDRADPSDPASGQRGPIRPCQIRIAVLDRLALLSVRTSRDASLDTGGVKRYARSIKTIVLAPLSRNLYKWDTTKRKADACERVRRH